MWSNSLKCFLLFQSPDSVMLALKLDGSRLLDRNIRVKRSVKEKEKKTPPGRPSRSKESKRDIRNNFKTNPGQKQTAASSFKGEMADPAAKRGKGLKKKIRHKKKKPNVHI